MLFKAHTLKDNGSLHWQIFSTGSLYVEIISLTYLGSSPLIAIN